MATKYYKQVRVMKVTLFELTHAEAEVEMEALMVAITDHLMPRKTVVTVYYEPEVE